MPIKSEQLVDPKAGLIDPDVFMDPQIYEREMDKVFGRSWLFLGHECQLKEPGDYITTFMGADPVIVIRQRDGSIKALLNACRHRGMKVCRTDLGNTRVFRCPYHGWSYSISGDLMGMPHQRLFGPEIDKPSLGLRQVPRLESMFGLIFASFSAEVAPLADYLGDAVYFLEASFGRLEGGIELLEGVNKWNLKCNWKFGAEQFSTDMYHVYTAHASPYLALDSDDSQMQGSLQSTLAGGQFSSPYGHGFGWWETEPEDSVDLKLMPAILKDYFAATRSDVIKRLGAERAKMESHGTLFPNFSWLYTGTPIIRVWQPKSPTDMQVQNHIFVDASAPADVRTAMRKFITLLFGTSGLFEQDDSEIWTTIQRNLHSPRVRETPMLNFMGLGKPITQENKLGRRTGVVSEMGSRGWFHRWSQLMESDSYPQPCLLDEVQPEVAESA